LRDHSQDEVIRGMTRLKLVRFGLPASPDRQNIYCLFIFLAAGTILHGGFDPLPAGLDPDETVVDIEAVIGSASDPTVPAALASISSTAPSAGAQSEAAQSEAAQCNTGTPGSIEPTGDSRAVLTQTVELLRKGVDQLDTVSDYVATFYKREQIGGAMGDGQVMKIKLRHAPFSVYMRWLVGDKGREVLYVDGENNGKMLVKVGGVRGRLLPCIKLDPTGSLAMRESRHPITMVGLKNLAAEILAHREEELERSELKLTCRIVDGPQFDDRPCYCFIVDYDNPQVRAPYRRSIQYVDKEYLIPVCVKNYGWSTNADGTSHEPDESSLIEHYSYSGVRINSRLADIDFDRANSNYRLRR